MFLWDFVGVECPDVWSEAYKAFKVSSYGHLEEGLSSGCVLSHEVFASFIPSLVEVMWSGVAWV